MPHHVPPAVQDQQWDEGERKLYAQDNLAENQNLEGVDIQQNDAKRRYGGDESGDLVEQSLGILRFPK